MLMREDQPIASSVHIHTRTYNTAYTTKKATQFGDKQAFIHIVIVSSTSELQKKKYVHIRTGGNMVCLFF